MTDIKKQVDWDAIYSIINAYYAPMVEKELEPDNIYPKSKKSCSSWPMVDTDKGSFGFKMGRTSGFVIHYSNGNRKMQPSQ